MSNHPQGRSTQEAPSNTGTACPGCPTGNSLPLVSNEDTCGEHGWWNAQDYS